MLLTLTTVSALLCTLDVLFSGLELASRIPLFFLRIFHFFGSQSPSFLGLLRASTGGDTDAFDPLRCWAAAGTASRTQPGTRSVPDLCAKPQHRATTASPMFLLRFPGFLDFPLFWLPGWCFPVSRSTVSVTQHCVHTTGCTRAGVFYHLAAVATQLAPDPSQQNTRGAPLATHDSYNCKSVGFP